MSSMAQIMTAVGAIVTKKTHNPFKSFKYSAAAPFNGGGAHPRNNNPHYQQYQNQQEMQYRDAQYLHTASFPPDHQVGTNSPFPPTSTSRMPSIPTYPLDLQQGKKY